MKINGPLLQTGTKLNNKTSGFYISSEVLLTKKLRSIPNGEAQSVKL